jgi:TRAP transporter TAXI family solute receptor
MAKRNLVSKSYCDHLLPIILAICFIVLPSSALSYELLLGAGEPGSFSYFAGKAVCRAINKAEGGLTCRVVPSSSYTDNLTNIQSGSLDLALVNSKIIYDAFHGRGLFRFVSLDYDQLRLLMPLYREPVTLIVRKDAKVSSVQDLAGKKINVGAPFSLQENVFSEIMVAEGWQSRSFRLVQKLSAVHAQDFIALHSGSVQAMIHVGMHPDRRIEQSLAGKSTAIVGVSGQSIDRLIKGGSGFYMHSIPAGTYPGHDRSIETLALESMLVTSADADRDMVAMILDALLQARDSLQYAHPSFLKESVDVETLNNSYLHPHPEAILFFQANQGRL